MVVLVLLALVAGCTAAAPAQRARPNPLATPTPTADNADWAVHTPGPEHAIEGFADRVSVAPGYLWVPRTVSLG